MMENVYGPLIGGAERYAGGMLKEEERKRQKSEEAALRKEQQRTTAAQYAASLATGFGVEPAPGVLAGTPYGEFAPTLAQVAPEVRTTRDVKLAHQFAPVERVPGAQVEAARRTFPEARAARAAPAVPMLPPRSPLEDEIARARIAHYRRGFAPQAGRIIDPAGPYTKVYSAIRQGMQAAVVQPWAQELATRARSLGPANAADQRAILNYTLALSRGEEVAQPTVESDVARQLLEGAVSRKPRVSEEAIHAKVLERLRAMPAYAGMFPETGKETKAYASDEEEARALAAKMRARIPLTDAEQARVGELRRRAKPAPPSPKK